MFALWTKCSIVHSLVFVRLAHDRRFVGAVLFLFLRFVFIRISGRHCVAHDHEGTPVDQPGGKFLGDVWGHVVAPRVWTLGACLNSHCSILSESDSSLGYEQVFSPLMSTAAPLPRALIGVVGAD